MPQASSEDAPVVAPSILGASSGDAASMLRARPSALLPLAGDIIAASAALAGFLLVYLGAVANGYAGFTKLEQGSVRGSFQSRAWFAAVGIIFSISACGTAALAKWQASTFTAGISLLLFCVHAVLVSFIGSLDCQVDAAWSLAARALHLKPRKSAVDRLADRRRGLRPPSLHIFSFQLWHARLSASRIKASPTRRFSCERSARMPVMTRDFAISFVRALR
jgi:hypothetical protein